MLAWKKKKETKKPNEMIRNMNCFKCNLAIFNLHVSESENEKGKPGYRLQPSLVYNPPHPPILFLFLYVEAFVLGGRDSTFKEKKRNLRSWTFLKRERANLPALGFVPCVCGRRQSVVYAQWGLLYVSRVWVKYLWKRHSWKTKKTKQKHNIKKCDSESILLCVGSPRPSPTPNMQTKNHIFTLNS